MNKALLERQFERLGARVLFTSLLDTLRPGFDRVQLDVNHDAEGVCFEIRTNPDRLVQLVALDVRPADRRLLLMAVLPAGHDALFDERRLFLCGHADTDWFVSELPELAPVLSVASARMALQPITLCPPRFPMRHASRPPHHSDQLAMLN